MFRYFFILFYFSILIFWVHRAVKRQKMVQNDKKLCLLCSISQEPYIMWLLFMVQMCKMIISPGIFFNIKILIFYIVKGLKEQKMAQMAKISVHCTLYFRNHISYGLHLWYTCMYKRIISPVIFFIFFFKDFDFLDHWEGEYRALTRPYSVRLTTPSQLN